MNVININSSNYNVSSKAIHKRTLKLYNGRVVRFITEIKDKAQINDDNIITFLETLLCVKDTNGKLSIERIVKTIKKPEGLSKEEIRTYKADASALCKNFQKEPSVIVNGREINTVFYDSVNFIDALTQSIKQVKELL